jgi:hypothetical protein
MLHIQKITLGLQHHHGQWPSLWRDLAQYLLYPSILQSMLLHLLHHQQVKLGLKDSLPANSVKPLMVVLCWAPIRHKARTIGLVTGENALSIGPNGPEGICPAKE